MSTLTFTEKIKAPKEKVWLTLWNDASYRKWTSVFSEGSYAESDWNEGSRVYFLSPGGDGMFSTIQKKIPGVEMSFKHLGEIKNGMEELKEWGDASESYYLEEKEGITELTVKLVMESSPDFEKYFKETFPKALAILKDLSEQETN